MTTALWVMTGALLGFVSFSYLGLIRGAGLIFSIILGGVGAMAGGKMIAPMFVDATAVPDAFSLGALVVATAVAAAFLAIGTVIYNSIET